MKKKKTTIYLEPYALAYIKWRQYKKNESMKDVINRAVIVEAKSFTTFENGEIKEKEIQSGLNAHLADLQ